MPAISVIVPVYNKEKCLRRCLDSLLAQTFSGFELLLVDDGSTDSSGDVCDEYAIRDERIRVVHEENGGVSRARNAGIENAQGECLMFVDADDCVEAGYLESLLPRQDEDFVMDSSDDRSPAFEDGVHDGKEMVETALSGWQILCPWGKLFKADVLKKHRLRFDEAISLGEDTLFNLEYLLHASSLRTSSSREYHYAHEVHGSLSKQACPFRDAKYKALRVHALGRLLAEKYDDPLMEVLMSKYAGITWTLWHSLLPYPRKQRARRVKELFHSPEMSALMRNYQRCDESGKKYALFHWLGRHRLFGIASSVIP